MRNTRTRNLPRAGLGVKVGPAVSTGNGMDFLVGRLSYTFGLTGAALPNMFHTRFVSAALSEKRAGASPGAPAAQAKTAQKPCPSLRVPCIIACFQMAPVGKGIQPIFLATLRPLDVELGQALSSGKR